ncbi:MAG: SLATT domain-containing protein [Streptosporangiaceae bacterium]
MAVQPTGAEVSKPVSRSHWRTSLRRLRPPRFSRGDWAPAITLLNEGQQLYVRLRWVNSIEKMEKRHGKDVLRFFLLRSLSVLGGVAITALSGIGLSGSSSSGAIRWTIFALGFLVAGSAGMEQLGQYGRHRVLSREAREDLLTAGFGYLLPKPDPNDGAAFEAFRGSVERILKEYNDKYTRTLPGQ